ncbi:toll/interleukin-1 receptor domain-containing protein [Aquidulcibacter paucihalophilus]|uniref:toll/interleukin-1 receptor domain-containing protein n=1 Tax=Aquidulcibacter paucihalophilus TaxID=1978549 RepID=UPI000A18AFF1|nr:toll/interleukin-1 receptor domain-containing protein [Aquidulcibacter paucihalophilus]
MSGTLGSSYNLATFGAFVSYSHTDKAAAGRFHKKLESYRLPKRLLKDSVNSNKDGSLGPIFRDREDLPAAEDLTASVKQALALSRSLLVLCSPSAKNSRWVQYEINLFRELHPNRPVLAALLYGEPDESFPVCLRANSEPLAADLRKNGDGPDLGFLKVVAGIAGVPLDALIQRNAQRQMRSVMAVTGLVSVVTVAMVIMTTIALQARNEARVQRDEAEGLVDYLLNDLREDLNGVAGVAVLTKVNKRALAYYENQESFEDLSPDSLARRALAIGRLGEDAMNRQDFPLARRNFEERVRTTKRLLVEDPTNQERMFDHAVSLNSLSVLAQAEGNNSKAQAGFEESWLMLSALKTWKGEDLKRRRATALVAGNLCAMDALNQRVAKETVEKCKIAVELGKVLVRDDDLPSRSAYDLVFNLTWLSVALQQVGKIDAAANARRDALALTDQLALENPLNRKIKAQRMETYGYLSRFEDLAKRRSMLKIALSIGRDLTALDPEHEAWKQHVKNYQHSLQE